MAESVQMASSNGDINQSTARLAFSDPSIGTESIEGIAHQARTIISNDLPYDASLDVDGKRSLANIGLQAFWLGFTCAGSLLLGILAAQFGYEIWRLFAFMVVLSIFHFLEYWSTARFNVMSVKSGSFLLFTNGMAYNIAYMLAVVEILVSIMIPDYARSLTTNWSRGIGFGLILLGQLVRSVAMAQAGTNFNHIPQKIRRDGHVLVTSGIYGRLRHPAYAAFFWWAIGTQLLVGNKFCTIGYVLVLWRFFYKRIQGET